MRVYYQVASAGHGTVEGHEDEFWLSFEVHTWDGVNAPEPASTVPHVVVEFTDNEADLRKKIIDTLSAFYSVPKHDVVCFQVGG